MSALGKLALTMTADALEQLSVAMSNGATLRNLFERDDGPPFLEANNPHKPAIPRYSQAVQAGHKL